MDRYLVRLKEKARESGYHLLRAATVVGDGKIEVIEADTANLCQNSYSIAKAFTVTAVGLLFDRGLLDPSEKIVDMLAKYCPDSMGPLWRELTLDFAMRHMGGLPLDDMDIDTHNLPRECGLDYLGHILSEDLHDKPGTVYRYSDTAFYLAARCVTERCGRKMDEFLLDELFNPLGFREMAWSRCPMGHPMGGTGLYICAEDMVKLAKLYMDGGVWQGRRILSEEWVRRTLATPYELSPHCGGRAFGKGGMRGQMLLAIPEAHRCVAWHACEDHAGGLVEAAVALALE